MSKTIWESLAERTEWMAENALEGIAILSDWEAVRSERKREFSRALGLDPQPERCELDVRVFSEFSGPGFRARNLGFQILPNCWSSATIYYPDPMPKTSASAFF